MNEVIVGFDAAEDTSLVVMRRHGDGTWQIESAAGDGCSALAAQVAALCGTFTAPQPEPVSPAAAQVADWVAEWMSSTAGTPRFELTDAQRDLLARMYKQHIREGKLRWTHTPAAVP